MAITRSEVVRRARWSWPLGSVPYSQTARWRDGYRQDCSGYVDMCLGIPPGPGGGPNTVSLVTDGWVRKIGPGELKPGDLIGRCGPGTAGDAGHVQLFTGWANTDPSDSHYDCFEQTGGGNGPHYQRHDWPTGYEAYRFRGIIDDAPGGPVTQPLDNDMQFLIWRVEGLAHLRDAVLGGPEKGAPLELVRAIQRIDANAKTAADKPTSSTTVTVDPAAAVAALAANPTALQALADAIAGSLVDHVIDRLVAAHPAQP